LVSTWNLGEIKIQKFRKRFIHSLQEESNDEIKASKLKTVLNIKAADQISTSVKFFCISIWNFHFRICVLIMHQLHLEAMELISQFLI